MRRAAAAIEAGDLCLAGIGPSCSLCRTRRLRRSPSSPKLPSWRKAGRPGKTSRASPPDNPTAVNGRRREARAARPPLGAEPAAHVSPYAPASGQEPALPLDDGVYRPGTDDARVILTGGAEEEEASRRSNGPPDDFTRLEDVFPGLRDAPGLAIPLAPIDGFFGVSALADEANLEATLAQYRALVAEIKQVDPSFVDQELLPPGGIAGLTWQGRNNLINNLRMAAGRRLLSNPRRRRAPSGRDAAVLAERRR